MREKRGRCLQKSDFDEHGNLIWKGDLCIDVEAVKKFNRKNKL